jgi:hypothetical protein
MTVAVKKVSRSQVISMILSVEDATFTDIDRDIFQRCLIQTSSLWVGMVNNELICTWGLIPPTLLSDRAYLWLYTTDKIEDHKFLFIRHSQRAVEDMLKEYPKLYGVTKVGGERTIQWLKWLGAKFDPPEGQLLPFVIRKK